MNRSRPLSEMLTDVLGGVMQVQGAHGIRATSVELSLPIEVSVREENSEQVFIADVPLFRWRTEFDRLPGRLSVRLEEVVK